MHLIKHKIKWESALKVLLLKYAYWTVDVLIYIIITRNLLLIASSFIATSVQSWCAIANRRNVIVNQSTTLHTATTFILHNNIPTIPFHIIFLNVNQYQKRTIEFVRARANKNYSHCKTLLRHTRLHCRLHQITFSSDTKAWCRTLFNTFQVVRLTWYDLKRTL